MGIDDDERVEACRVHDMVFDLICSLSSEENFVTILDGAERKATNSQSKVRRLSIQKSNIDMPTISMPHVRSVFFANDVGDDQVSPISSFQVLRVLDLEGCTISSIGYLRNLLHLRYLGLKYTDVKELPKEIGKLRFLQILDLRKTGIKELPSGIVRLRHLVCLYVHRHIKLPSGVDNLTSLEVLCDLMVGQLSPGVFNLDIVKELRHLTKLRVLRIECRGLDESLDKALVESMRSLHKLECLDISAGGGRVDLMREGWAPPPQLRRLTFQGPTCSFLTLPPWMNSSSLPVLSCLVILVDKVRPGDIRVLGMLPALRSLYLVSAGAGGSLEGHDEEVMSVVTAGAFPCATECNFFGIAAAPSVFPRGAAPMLKLLRFSFPAAWIARGDFDMGMGHLPSLERVMVDVRRIEASDEEVEAARAALSAAADGHPNRPTLNISER